MAAVTPNADYAVGATRARPFLGDRFEVHQFDTLNDGDTWTVPGGTNRIRLFGWRTLVGNISFRWTRTSSTVLTFNSNGPLSSSQLLFWIKGATPSA